MMLRCALLLVVGSLAIAPVASAGIVDITLDGNGDVYLRADAGVSLVGVGMLFEGAGGETFSFLPLQQPEPNVAPPPTSFTFTSGGNLLVQLLPPLAPGQFIQTGGSTFLIGTLSNALVVTAFGCPAIGCIDALGGGVIQDDDGVAGGSTTDLTSQSSYVAMLPEPAPFALMSFALVAFAFIRSRRA